MVPVEHDHPGAGSEDGPLEALDRVVERVEPHQAHEGRRLATRDDQPVETLELLRLPHLDGVGTEPPQHRDVLAEVPLQGKNADPKRLHAPNSIGESEQGRPFGRPCRGDCVPTLTEASAGRPRGHGLRQGAAASLG